MKVQGGLLAGAGWGVALIAIGVAIGKRGGGDGQIEPQGVIDLLRVRVVVLVDDMGREQGRITGRRLVLGPEPYSLVMESSGGGAAVFLRSGQAENEMRADRIAMRYGESLTPITIEGKPEYVAINVIGGWVSVHEGGPVFPITNVGMGIDEAGCPVLSMEKYESGKAELRVRAGGLPDLRVRDGFGSLRGAVGWLGAGEEARFGGEVWDSKGELILSVPSAGGSDPENAGEGVPGDDGE